MGIVLGITNFGRNLLTLDPVLITQPVITEWTREVIESESMVMLLSLALCLRLSMLTEMVLLANMRDKPPSLARILNDVYVTTITYLGLRFLPGGPAMFFVFTYLLVYTFNYGYYTLKSAQFDTPYANDLLRRGRHIQIALKFCWAIALLGHYLYVSQVAITSPVFMIIANMEGMYSLALIASGIRSVKQLYRSR